MNVLDVEQLAEFSAELKDLHQTITRLKSLASNSDDKILVSMHVDDNQGSLTDVKLTFFNKTEIFIAIFAMIDKRINYLTDKISSIVNTECE